MLRANSLLYAVYICLIVSILCGALLYYANLYNQLNLFYNTREDLYIQNQSVVNFALGNGLGESEIALDTSSGIKSSFRTKPHGLLDLLIVESYVKNDTIASAHFVGQYTKSADCIYLANFSKGLSFGGNVKLIGDKKLPTKRISEEYLSNKEGELTSSGTIELSDIILPQIHSRFKNVFNSSTSKKVNLIDVERSNDSVYYNSFLKETIEIELKHPILNNLVIKGNFILNAKDSIVVGKKTVLEDVILKAPKVSFHQGFKGTVQVFATKEIHVEKEVELSYPTVLCLKNTTLNKSTIKINQNCKIYGAVVQFGNEIENIDENEIIVQESTLIVGDIYCTGRLMVEGRVFGTVMTNRFFHRFDLKIHSNCIIDAEIDCSKKPNYFVSVPILENIQSQYYVVQKKVL